MTENTVRTTVIDPAEVFVTITPEERWEQGIDHDPRSLRFFDFIRAYDYAFNNDSLGFKAGGAGDNGEELMYLMDEYFAALDTRAKKEQQP